jgi:predicted dehydrogenase
VSTLRVGVVGAGLIGSRRAATAAEGPGSSLIAVSDIDQDRSEHLATRHGCQNFPDWRDMVADPGIDAVVVSTFNSSLCPVTIAALDAGKHVLCEKPLGCNSQEAAAMVAAAGRNRRILKVGLNLRFHPALRQAHRLCAEGAIGELYFVRGMYGHGGRSGYAREWRGDAELAGGGELLDQGVHLVDLAQWFVGELKYVHGHVFRWFWDVAPLEDNAFVTLSGSGKKIVNLHGSWTEWKNRFSFEVYGHDGFICVKGLGGNYGTETLTVALRRNDGPPQESVSTFDFPDLSWQADWWDFLTAIETGRRPEVDGEEALGVMRLIDQVYADTRGALTSA